MYSLQAAQKRKIARTSMHTLGHSCQTQIRIFMKMKMTLSCFPPLCPDREPVLAELLGQTPACVSEEGLQQAEGPGKPTLPHPTSPYSAYLALPYPTLPYTTLDYPTLPTLPQRTYPPSTLLQRTYLPSPGVAFPCVLPAEL